MWPRGSREQRAWWGTDVGREAKKETMDTTSESRFPHFQVAHPLGGSRGGWVYTDKKAYCPGPTNRGDRGEHFAGIRQFVKV
jgi:hypothetical protein